MGKTIANIVLGGFTAGVLMVGGLELVDRAVAADKLTNQYDFDGRICNERVFSKDNWFGSEHLLYVTKEDGTLVEYSARESKGSPRLELNKITTRTSNGKTVFDASSPNRSIADVVTAAQGTYDNYLVQITKAKATQYTGQGQYTGQNAPDCTK